MEVVIILARMANETEIDYHKRLVYGKLRDKTLADVDYSEIAEALYGQQYASDVARRMMYGSRKTLDALEQTQLSAVDGDSILQEIEAKRRELFMERQRLFDQRREYRKLMSNDGRREYLYDALAAAANDLNNTVGRLFDDRPTIDFGGILSDNEAVLVLSDWHYGLVVSNAFNSYNTDICKERVRSIVAEAIQRIRLHECSVVHIVVLGDLFHGAIHTSARVASEELVCDQIMQVSEILAQAVLEISQHVMCTHVYMTYGNHGRTVQNKSDSIHRDNIERLIPWWLEQRFKGHDNIVVMEDTGTEFLFVNAAGHDIVAAHGDLDSVKGSAKTLPILFNKRYGKNVECIILGDKHHVESYEELDIQSMMCGSLCGSDDYANDKRLYTAPSQLMCIVTPKDGIDAEYRLRCCV